LQWIVAGPVKKQIYFKRRALTGGNNDNMKGDLRQTPTAAKTG
jgi:hypothetical protein